MADFYCWCLKIEKLRNRVHDFSQGHIAGISSSTKKQIHLLKLCVFFFFSRWDGSVLLISFAISFFFQLLRKFFYYNEYFHLISRRIQQSHVGLKSGNSMLRKLHSLLGIGVSAIESVRYWGREEWSNPFLLVSISVISQYTT